MIIAPMSASQRQIYRMAARFRDLNRIYNVYEAFRIRGDLDVEALAAGVDTVVSRHQALRTTLTAGGTQVVLPAVPGVLRVAGLPAGPPEVLGAAVRAECDELFDLHADPLARFVLFRAGAGDHVLVLVAHHIVIDAWSLRLLWQEIGTVYDGIRDGVPATLPPVRSQFADYAVAHDNWLTTGPARRMLDYWRGELAGCSDGATVPYDRDVPPAPATAGARTSVVLPSGLAAAVPDLARAAKVSVAAVMLCAWHLAVGAAAGASTVVIGVPIGSRTRLETLNTVGFMINTHALRLDLAGTTLRRLLTTCGGKLVAALVNQEMALPHVLETSRRDRSGGHPPLPLRPFQTMFGYQDRPPDPLRLTGLHVTPYPIEIQTRKADMTLHARWAGTTLTCELEYATSRYRRGTAEATLTRYVQALEHLVHRLDDPARSYLDGRSGGD